MGEAVVGYNIAVGLETESTYGTDAGSTRTWFEYISEDVDESHDTMVQTDTRGRVERDPGEAQGRKSVGGSFDVHVNSENIGYLLFYLLGSATSPTDNGDGSYEHTISIDTGTSEPFTWETDYGEVADKAKIATGCKMNSLSLDIADGIVTASAGLAGQDLDPDASPTSVTFASWPRTFDFKDFSATIGGTDVSIEIIGGSVDLASNNFEDDYRQGSQEIQSLPSGQVTVDLTLDIAYNPDLATDADQNAVDFLNQDVTDEEVIVTWTGDNIAGSNDHLLEVKFPHCYVESGSPVVSGPGERVERSVSIKSLHNYDASTAGFEARLVNTKSTQYS